VAGRCPCIYYLKKRQERNVRKRVFRTIFTIKTNPNSAKGPDKEKIVNKLHCILLTANFGKAADL
jgi:hypothetical protein